MRILGTRTCQDRVCEAHTCYTKLPSFGNIPENYIKSKHNSLSCQHDGDGRLKFREKMAKNCGIKRVKNDDK